MSDELERAEANLRSAEAELHKAEEEEVAAVRKIETAVEEIKAAEERHEIHFTVDGEPHETDRRELTPDEIIRKFGERDPPRTISFRSSAVKRRVTRERATYQSRCITGCGFKSSVQVR